MLKIILVSASLIIIPKIKWSTINLGILMVASLSVPALISITRIYTPRFLTGTDTISYTLVILRIWLSSLMLVASTNVKRTNFKPG